MLMRVKEIGLPVKLEKELCIVSKQVTCVSYIANSLTHSHTHAHMHTQSCMIMHACTQS